MEKLQLETFLNDMTYNSRYSFLEVGKDDDELMEVAKSKNIVLPALDLAVFKCIYAFTDRQNLNGCTLEKAEVEAALPTIAGKAIDFDHIRGKIVGHWADAKLEDDKIIAYGFFFKGNLPDEYEAIKELMEGGVLAISFEAYGVRNFTNAAHTEYTFSNIEFSGGALLINTAPAFPGSEVLEMAKNENQKRVLEFASKTSAPKTFIKEVTKGEESMEKEEKKQEIARFYTYDFETILNLIYSTEEELETYLNIDSIDFKNMKVSAKRMDNDEVVEISLKPKVKTLKQGSRNKEEIKMEEDKKKELAEETKAEETKVEIVKAEETKAEETKAADEKRETEVAELKSDLKAKEDEIAKLTKDVEDLQASIETKVEEAKKTTETLIERRSALGEVAKEMTDEQLLDEKEYQIALLKKENSELKAGKVEKASLEVGKTKEEKPVASVFKTQANIHAKAFGPETEIQE